MSPGRLWRTIRPLSAGQWARLALCRGRRRLMQAFPDAARARIARRAAALPLADPARPALAAVAGICLSLHRAMPSGDPDDVARGRFTLLNRDFDFGAPESIDWRGDFDEGANPLRRMTLAYMGYAVPLLARGSDEAIATVGAVLAGLAARSPFAAPGTLGDVWSPYAASHRLINLLSGLALWRRAGAAAGGAAEAEILDHVRFCAAVVHADPEHDLGYNHLMKNLTAVAVYGAALERVPAAFAMLDDAVAAALRQCVLGDGGHAERSPMYHLLALYDLDMLRASGLFAGRREGMLDETRAKMAAALAAMTHPDGDIALFGDAWLGGAPPAREAVGPRDAPATVRLEDTGYVRLGAGGDAVIFDCGPLGPADNPAHGHADFLALELSVAGARLIVDPGVATYTAGPLRDITRAAASHNGPRLEGFEPVEFWKSFRAGRRGRARAITDAALAGIAPLWSAGSHDGYVREGVAVGRYVGLWPGAAALVCDLWHGPHRRAECSGYLVPDGWASEVADPPVFTRDGIRVAFTALIGSLGEPAAGRRWARFAVEEPAHVLTIEPAAVPGARRAALWIAWSDAIAPPEAAALERLFEGLARAAAGA